MRTIISMVVGERGSMYLRVVAFVCLCACLLAPANLLAGKMAGNRWELLAVAYPPDRDVSVLLGGGERTLTSKGICKVKWRDEAASIEIEIERLPAASENGWAGRQYVLWAIDSEKRRLNLGPVPLRNEEAKWKVQVPFRIFGLLVTAEENPQAEAPSTAVALESLLPLNPRLVLPVFRVEVALVPPPP